MPLIRYGQKGYSGSSMSNRAVEAYENGEMPKSKWNKLAILKEIDFLFPKEVVDYFSTFPLMELFSSVMTKTSWHHTGKFANETDFYSVDEEKVKRVFKEHKSKSEREESRKKEIERREKVFLELNIAETIGEIKYCRQKIKEYEQLVGDRKKSFQRLLWWGKRTDILNDNKWKEILIKRSKGEIDRFEFDKLKERRDVLKQGINKFIGHHYLLKLEQYKSRLKTAETKLKDFSQKDRELVRKLSMKLGV